MIGFWARWVVQLDDDFPVRANDEVAARECNRESSTLEDSANIQDSEAASGARSGCGA
jgi:hypothetical protein